MTSTAELRPNDHYVKPGWFTRRVCNGLVAWLTRAGVSVWGSRVLEVRGRRSGEWRSTPVNLLETADGTYLVAPRGETQWVRNLRATGTGKLRLGRRTWDFTAVELPTRDSVGVRRTYLRRWRWEVGQFFDGVGADATDHELTRIAPRHPVFRLAVDVPR